MKNSIINFLVNFRKQNCIKFGGIKMKFDTRSFISKKWFYPRYAQGQPHEPSITRLFCDEIKKDDLVFDIGANQGYFTVLSTQLLNNQGSVHAFELDPVLIPLVQSSLSLNAYECSVSVIQCAVSDDCGDFLSFTPHLSGNLTTNSILYENNSNTKVFSQSISIDKYCEKLNLAPSFIKLDVEGAEFKAVSGMKEALKKFRPKLLVEIHPKQLREFDVEVESIANNIIQWVPEYSVYLVEDYRKNTINYLKKVNLKDILYGERPLVLYFRVN